MHLAFCAADCVLLTFHCTETAGARSTSDSHCLSLILAGIYYSDDKLLQSRIFSYSDTQRHRLGPNYLLLPVNAPKSAHHNNHHDGFMNFTHRDEEVRRLWAAGRQGCSSTACHF
jgi:Catalase